MTSGRDVMMGSPLETRQGMRGLPTREPWKERHSYPARVGAFTAISVLFETGEWCEAVAGLLSSLSGTISSSLSYWYTELSNEPFCHWQKLLLDKLHQIISKNNLQESKITMMSCKMYNFFTGWHIIPLDCVYVFILYNSCLGKSVNKYYCERAIIWRSTRFQLLAFPPANAPLYSTTRVP